MTFASLLTILKKKTQGKREDSLTNKERAASLMEEAVWLLRNKPIN